VAYLDECDIRSQEVLKVVKKNVFQELGGNSAEARGTTYHRNMKKGCKTLFYLGQCIDEANFEKIAATPKKHGISWRIAILEVSNSRRFNWKQCEYNELLLMEN